MKNVTVVGADGFIGSAIVKGLRQNGYNPVSITRNSKIENYNTNVIFYVAGLSTPYNTADIDLDLHNLIQFLNRLKNLRTRPLFVFASSAGTIYDPSGLQPYRESSKLLPVNLYGHGKLKQEAVIQQSEWVESLILRLSNIYGPYQKPKPGFGVIAHWVKKVCNDEPIEMLGNSQRDYLNIFDLVDIALKIMSSPQSCYTGLIVNIGSGNTVSLTGLYDKFIKATNRPIKVIKKPAREFDAISISIDNSLAKKLFNWQPKIPLEIGVKNALDAGFAEIINNV